MTDLASPDVMTIDKTTRVNLGILASLIVMTAYGAWSVSDLTSKVQANTERLDRGFQEVRQALDRNTAQLHSDGKSVVVLQQQVLTLETRVVVLEKRVRELEQAK